MPASINPAVRRIFIGFKCSEKQQVDYIWCMHSPNNKIQIERILFFSDAVIAIAITLLIIEIKAPHFGDHAGAAEVRQSLNELLPKFIAFLISFFVIAIYWKAHHYLFGYITAYTDKLIWLNTFFLLTIVLMPFSSAFYSENFGNDLAYAVYCLNIILTGIFNCWLVRYISSGQTTISTISGDRKWRRYHTLRSLVAPGVFLMSMILSFYSTGLSRLCFILIFPFIWWLNHRYKNSGRKLAVKNAGAMPAGNDLVA